MIYWLLGVLLALSALSLPIYALLSGMNSRRILPKLGYWLVASIYPCIVAGGVMLLILLISTEPLWDALFCACAFVLTEVLLLTIVFNLIRRRGVWIPLLAVFLCLCTASGWFYSKRIIDARIPTLSETSIVLSDYTPGSADSRLALTDEPSTLTLPSEGLPYLDGSAALYPIYAAVANAIYPPEAFTENDDASLFSSERWLDLLSPSLLECSSTGGAYRALIDGKADVIFVSAPSDAQLQSAATQGKEMVFTPIALDSFTFFVNTQNPIEALSSEQLRNIYAGEITDWSQFGANLGKIRAYQHSEESGIQSALVHFMGDVPLMPAPTINHIVDQLGILQLVADYKNYENAIGCSFRFHTTEMVDNGQIRLLSIDGIAPTLDNIRSGAYPLVQTFYAVTLASNENPSVARLIDWILSEQGQALIEKTGYVAVK